MSSHWVSPTCQEDKGEKPQLCPCLCGAYNLGRVKNNHSKCNMCYERGSAGS